MLLLRKPQRWLQTTKRTDVMMVLRVNLLWNTRRQLHMCEFYSSVLKEFACVLLNVMRFCRCTEIESKALTPESRRDAVHTGTRGGSESSPTFVSDKMSHEGVHSFCTR